MASTGARSCNAISTFSSSAHDLSCLEVKTLAISTPAEEVLNNAELLSIIFAFLKGIICSELRIRPGELEVGWTAPLAQLARVNRAFFHASVEVLWEKMFGVSAFFRMLLPDEADGTQLVSARLCWL